MSATMKIWLVIATSLVAVGVIVFVIVMSINGWDFTKIGTVKFRTNTYEVADEFSGISINTDTADIVFEPSNDEKCKVVCYEKEKIEHSVSVVDGVLKVGVTDNRQWYERIGITFKNQRITVYLPQSEYSSLVVKESTGDIALPSDFKFGTIDISVNTGNVNCSASATGNIKVTTTTGSVRVSNATADSLNISVITGDVTVSSVTCANGITVGVTTGYAHLEDIECKEIASQGSTGSITLKNAIAYSKFSVERTTGNVSFVGADAGEIFVRTSTGSVNGSLLTAKVFVANTSTGSVSVPSTTTGGKCEITTSTGNIRITIA